MKIKVRYFYPIWINKSDEAEIEIPDNVENIENYIAGHEESLLDKIADEAFDEIANLSSALDVGYAGIRLIKDKKDDQRNLDY